jgi:phosphoglycolate phosphatase-like HAD superfamily hydrolase
VSRTSPPGVLVFDLDGTLVDTWRLYMEAYRRALAPHLERAPTEAEIVARAPTSERRFLAEWVGPEAAEHCHAAMVEHYVALHDTHCEGLYEGVREMLDALAAAGVPLGVVTGKGRRAWETTARSLDLDRFEVVVTDDDVRHPKPHPEGLRAALEEMGVGCRGRRLHRRQPRRPGGRPQRGDADRGRALAEDRLRGA